MKPFGSSKTKPDPLDLSKIVVEPIASGHVLNRFDCGNGALNRFLKNKANKCARRREQAVFVAHLSGDAKCIGYYALQVGSDSVPDTRREKSSYLATYTAFPAINIGFLAVDRQVQNAGLGTFLLQDAFEKVAQVAEIVGFYAVTLQSLNAKTTAFYESIGFSTYAEFPHPKMIYPVESILAMRERSG